jgi:DNA-directed RNA polymerase specialized sigma24 family protein
MSEQGRETPLRSVVVLPILPCFDKASRGCSTDDVGLHKLPVHSFSQYGRAAGSIRKREYEDDPDLWLYRKKTVTLLRRYMRWSLEAGRVPSLLGRELFRSRITGLSSTTFEARVIFLHDVERCLNRLETFDQQLVGRVCLQEYDHEAAARILHCTRRTIERRLPELLDELSGMFLRAELLVRLPQTGIEDQS